MDSSQHHSLHRAFRILLTDRTNALANSVDILKNETLIFSIERDGINVLSLFIFLFLCCLSPASYDKLLLGKIILAQNVFCEQTTTSL